MKVLAKRWPLLNRLCVLFLVGSSVSAQTFQNLVPNGSFETYTQCPNNNSQIYFAAPWTGPRINSSDYNNACSSIMNVPYYGGINHPYPYYLVAKDGQAYAGIFYYKPTEDYREYAQVELTDTLIGDVCYYVEFYAANSQNAPFCANNVAANLSATAYQTTTLVTNNSIFNITSHITNYGNPILMDTVKWHKISGIYEATGIENFLVIGNFATNAQTDTLRISKQSSFANQAYMFLDAVSVYSINPYGALPWAYNDTSIVQGDSVYIGNKMGGLHFHPQWFNENGTYITTNAGITVSPTVTTKYIVHYTVCGRALVDTLQVLVTNTLTTWLNEFSALKENLKIYPNPAQDYILLSAQSETLLTKFDKATIYNHFGQLLREEKLVPHEGNFRIKTSDLPEGVYNVQLKSVNAGTVSKRFVIAR